MFVPLRPSLGPVLPIAAALLLALPSGAEAQQRTVPLADHHQHVISAKAAKGSYPLPLAEVAVPASVRRLLEAREQAWNDAGKLAQLYAADAIVLNGGDEDLPSWLRGRQQASDHLARLFGRAHRIKPVMFRQSGDHAALAGYYYRPELDRHFGQVLLSLARQRDGSWRIVAEAPVFPGPPASTPVDADAVIKQLDEAGIRRAALLSVAYWYGSGWRSTDDGPEDLSVRTENDWAAAQAARYPDRLFAFCSFNPLKSYALAELERCAATGKFTGIKLHLGNSRVDLRNADHSALVARVFAAANRLRLPIIVHLWTDPAFEQTGGEHVTAFLDRVLPSAPDIPIQVAHMAGGGRSTAPAMAVFVEAFRKRDPRVAKLYFDTATLVEGESAEGLRRDVEHMRAIGLDRFLYGTDTPPPPANQSWAGMHVLPLTDEEFRTLAANVAPYFPK